MKLKELQDMNYEQRTKNREQQIEEMARIINGSTEIDTVAYYRCMNIAKTIYNAGYQKLPEDSVVLSMKEWECLHTDYAKALYNVRQNAIKETAEKLLDLLVPDCKACDENWHSGCLCLRATLAEKIAKQCGGEIKE